jgi:hypothetical protein
LQMPAHFLSIHSLMKCSSATFALSTFTPWKRRPSGLTRNATPQFVHVGRFKTYKRQNPDDPTRLLNSSHVLVATCPLCNRSRFIPSSKKNYFFTCCEGVALKPRGNMRDSLNKAATLEDNDRKWDFEHSRPRCNPHRPRPKGRSKFKK